jgi:hypothetical protein
MALVMAATNAHLADSGRKNDFSPSTPSTAKSAKKTKNTKKTKTRESLEVFLGVLDRTWRTWREIVFRRVREAAAGTSAASQAIKS